MSNILIVDDEASICWAFRESLSDDGHKVEVAATAEEGLRIAGSNALDVVVLDVRLPGMDGLTAMRSFREQHRTRPDRHHHGLRQPRDRSAGARGRGLRLPGQAVRPRPGDDRREACPGKTAGPRAAVVRAARPRNRGAHRLLAGHAGAVQEHRAGRADRRAGVDHGRERDRQGAGRPRDSPP